MLQLPPDEPSAAALRRLAEEDAGLPDADLVLAFLPPSDGLAEAVGALAELWPDAARAGCEAMTQFAGDALATGGTLHLFRFAGRSHRAEVELVPGSAEEPPAADRLAGIARRLARGLPVLLIVDGLRFPVQPALASVRAELARRGIEGRVPVAGGLASQGEPFGGPHARVFAGSEIHPSALVAVTLHGLATRIEVVRGWDPASPVYTVTRAEGNVLWEIDSEPAASWFRRFFTVDGELAPLPETAWRFPLIVEGPRADRRGLYRSMRAFDEPGGAVTLWGDLETGDEVRLGMGNEASLVRRAAELARAVSGGRPEAAILYSCVGREVVLGASAAQEIESVGRALGCPAVSGFFSFGEIGPTDDGGPAFYNHTAILVLLREEEAAGAGAPAAPPGPNG